jgi:hypothetical protein
MVLTLGITTTTEAIMATDIQNLDTCRECHPDMIGAKLARLIWEEKEGSIFLVPEPKRYVAQWRDGVCLLIPGACVATMPHHTLMYLCEAFVENTVNREGYNGMFAVDGYGVWWDSLMSRWAVSANTSFNSWDMAESHCRRQEQRFYWDNHEMRNIQVQGGEELRFY